MRTSKLFTLLLAVLCCLAFSYRAEAATGYSDLNYNSFINTVDGYSETQLSFIESYYYDAVADAYLYDQYGNTLDHGYAEGGSQASVFTRAAASPGVSYFLYTDHYVTAYFFYCDYYCDSPRYRDECGFSDFYFSDYFYGSYFSSNCYYVCYIFYYYIYLGTTGDSVTAPQPCPNITLEIRATFGGSNAVINNATKPALVGAFVQLEALAITPDGPTTEGSFQWSADGGARTPPNDFPLPPYLYRVFWTAEGNKKVTVKYRPPDSSCEVSASVNINVTTPTLVSFTGQMREDEINNGARCSTIEGITYTLGCLTNQPGLRNDPGITFTATIQPPAGYISAPSESKVKFVQLINPFSRRRQRGSSVDECQTLRGTFASTEWLLDTTDPYDPFPRALQSFDRFNPGAPITIETSDSPGFGLDVPGLITLDYLYANDLFEMYVVYFVGDQSNPLVSRYLGYLPWTWGGEVVYDPSLSPPYRQTQDFTVPGPKQGFSALNYRQPFQGNVRDLTYGSCPGDSEPLPDPDPRPDPCWNGSYYTCD